MGQRQKSANTRPAERPVLQFRVHPEVHEQIRKAAREHKISASQEAERRLEQSFKNQDAESQIRHLNEILAALTAQRAREGQVIGGWLLEELRSRGLDESHADLVEIVRAYFGTRGGNK